MAGTYGRKRGAIMAFGYEKAPNKYIVQWQEIVTYEVEVEAYDEDEAHELALKGNAGEDIVDCDYWDGSLQITLEEEGEVEEDPDYGYKLEQEEKEED